MASSAEERGPVKPDDSPDTETQVTGEWSLRFNTVDPFASDDEVCLPYSHINQVTNHFLSSE